MFFSVPGLVLGLRDTDINNHPEDKLINFFFLMWERRGRGIVPRGCDIWTWRMLQKGEGRAKGRAWSNAGGYEIHGFRELWNSWIQGVAGSQGPRRVTEGTCRQLRQIIRSAEGAVEGSGLCPESIRQAPLLLFVFSSFLFLKFWKYDNTFTGDLENTEQSYI